MSSCQEKLRKLTQSSVNKTTRNSIKWINPTKELNTSTQVAQFNNFINTNTLKYTHTHIYAFLW